MKHDKKLKVRSNRKSFWLDQWNQQYDPYLCQKVFNVWQSAWFGMPKNALIPGPAKSLLNFIFLIILLYEIPLFVKIVNV